jgi:hypothetical protein
MQLFFPITNKFTCQTPDQLLYLTVKNFIKKN